MKNIKPERYLQILKKENPALYSTSKEMLKKAAPNNILYTSTVCAVAPILLTYILWVLSEAKNNNIKRLYFLARDGYIMKKIADIICEQHNLDIECRYLYCSRIAWRIPQYHLEKEKCLDKICINSIEVNLEKIFDRACLTVPEREVIYNELQIDDMEKVRHLQWYEVLQYKDILSKSNTFLQYVYRHSEQTYENTIGYLNQEGLFDTIKYAIVDTGWTGSMQTSLSCLLGGKKIEGFYFGIYNLPIEAESQQFHSFFFNRKTNIRNKVYFNNNLFECMCSSPDGMTVEYKRTEDRYLPVFSSDKNINLEHWELQAYMDAIIEYTHHAIKHDEIMNYNHKSSNKMILSLCKEFMVYPSKAEAECYGGYLFSDDITEKNVNKLAAELTYQEIRQNFLLLRIANRLKIKKYDMTYRQSCWIEASIMKCTSINGEKYIWHMLMFRWIQYSFIKIFRNNKR